MANMVEMDVSEIRKLAKFFRQAPRLFSRAAGGYLNTLAFGNKAESKKIIDRRLVVRSPKFIHGNMPVIKARSGQPLNKLVSRFGSRSRDRYSGLEEQETGQQTDRKRRPTIEARAGNKQKKVKPSVRLRKANQFRSPDDYQGKNSEHRVIVMLQSLLRNKWRKPFIIKGHRKFKHGLYKFKRNKIVMLQSFEPKTQSIKRVRWLSGGLKSFSRKSDPREIWSDNIEHVLKSVKLRKRR